MNPFMQIALREGQKAVRKRHGGPFGAVVVKDGAVLAKAHNQVVKKKDCTCHGEMNAIRRACKKLRAFDLSGCELYTTAEPCPMCLSAILWANISKVYYGCNIVDTEKIGFRDLAMYDYQAQPNKSDFIVELDRAACLELYNEYERSAGKTRY